MVSGDCSSGNEIIVWAWTGGFLVCIQKSAVLPYPSTKQNPAPLVVNTRAVSQPLCEVFDSLVSAIWWSVSQCASAVGCQTFLDPSLAAIVPVSQVASEETRRRLLSSIVLVGGGACEFAGQCLRKWLITELMTKWSATNECHTSRPPVEVFAQQDLSADEIAWFGARLVLTTDAVNDMWITCGEWQKLGSRVLREKAPFLWWCCLRVVSHCTYACVYNHFIT